MCLMPHPGRIDSIQTFLRMIRRRVATDQDAITWYSGDAGNGKSRLSMMINRRVDATFERRVIAGTDAISFNNLDFLRSTIGKPRGTALQGDELKLFARTVMQSDQQILLEWMKDSRGLGLILSLIFPEEDLIDEKAILFRAHYRVHVEPGWTFRVFVKRAANERQEDVPFGNWWEIFHSTFPKLRGQLDDAYQKQKLAHMQSVAPNLLASISEIENRRAKRFRKHGERGVEKAPPTMRLPQFQPLPDDDVA